MQNQQNSQSQDQKSSKSQVSGEVENGRKFRIINKKQMMPNLKAKKKDAQGESEMKNLSIKGDQGSQSLAKEPELVEATPQSEKSDQTKESKKDNKEAKKIVPAPKEKHIPFMRGPGGRSNLYTLAHDRLTLPAYMNGTQLYFTQINQQRDTQMWYDIGIVLFQLVSLVLALLQYQYFAMSYVIDPDAATEEESADLEDGVTMKNLFNTVESGWVRIGIVLCAMISMKLVVLRYYSKLEILKFRTNRVDENLSLGMMDLMIPLIIEIILMALINPPFVPEWSLEVLQIGKEVRYIWDACVVFFNTLRLAFYIIRASQHYSLWLTERARRTATINGANSSIGSNGDIVYAIKMHLNLNPIGVIVGVFLLMQFVFTILFYLSEVGLKDSGHYNRFEKITNAAWVTSQLLLSSGISGQEVPITNLGHMIAAFCSFGGTLTVALLIVFWRSITKFTPYEEQVFKRTKEKQMHLYNDPLRREASLVIKNFILLRYLRKHDNKQEMPLRASTSLHLIQSISKFHALRMKALLREPRPDILLSKFHTTLQGSAKQIDKGLQEMRSLQKKTSTTIKVQQSLLNNAKKSVRLSNTLCNLSQLLTEFGPQKDINKLTEIRGDKVLGVHELKQGIFVK